LSGLNNSPNNNTPVENSMKFSAWLHKNIQVLYGFFGWYLVNGLIWMAFGGPYRWEFASPNLYIFPANLLTLILLAVVKRTRKIAMGILLAIALNLVISLLLGLVFNGVCFVPFFFMPD